MTLTRRWPVYRSDTTPKSKPQLVLRDERSFDMSEEDSVSNADGLITYCRDTDPDMLHTAFIEDNYIYLKAWSRESKDEMAARKELEKHQADIRRRKAKSKVSDKHKQLAAMAKKLGYTLTKD